MAWAVLALGGNLGDRERILQRALIALADTAGICIQQCSSIYETLPFDVLQQQDNYLNCCVRIETALSPHDLLTACQAIESKLGRVRTGYHAARTIDIDILFYERFSSDDPVLTIPHPGILDRAFVMLPLLDLYPGASVAQFSFASALNQVDQSTVWFFRPPFNIGVNTLNAACNKENAL